MTALIPGSHRTARGLIAPEPLLSRLPLRGRCLGSAVFLSAIADYRMLNPSYHIPAGRFLYPTRPSFLERYNWAISMLRSLDPEWLRQQLDRMRPLWDDERARRVQLPGRSRQLGRPPKVSGPTSALPYYMGRRQ